MSKDNVIHFMPRPVAPASPAITPRHAINNELKLLPGFIFIACPDEHAASLPPAYLVERLGSFGYYGKLDHDHINGFDIIKADEYHV